MQPHATVAQGEELQAAAHTGQLGAGHDELVGSGVRPVDVVGRLGINIPLGRGPIAQLADDGAIAQEERLMVGRTVHQVDLEAQAVAQPQLVAQGEVADVVAVPTLYHVHAPHRAPCAVRAIPHQVVAVEVLMAEGRQLAIGALAHLHTQLIGCRQLIGHAGAPRIAGHVVPELAAEVEIDGRAVVLVAADVDHLLAGRQGPLLRRLIVEVEPVGGIEETGIERRLVQALAIAVGQPLGDLPVHLHVEIAAAEARRVVAHGAVDIVALIVAAGLHTEMPDRPCLSNGGHAHQPRADQ